MMFILAAAPQVRISGRLARISRYPRPGAAAASAFPRSHQSRTDGR